MPAGLLGRSFNVAAQPLRAGHCCCAIKNTRKVATHDHIYKVWEKITSLYCKCPYYFGSDRPACQEQVLTS